MIEVLLCLIGGGLLGWKKALPNKVLRISSRLMTLGVFFLLLTMGIRIGSDQETFSHLGDYGLQAFIFAFLTIVASLILVGIFEWLFVGNSLQLGNESLEINIGSHPYRLTALILVALIIGMLIGLFLFPKAAYEYLTFLTNGALYFTLFAVGLDLGYNGEVWHQVIHLGWHVFLAPVGVALGSILTGMIAGKLFGWTWQEGGAIAAGFGWYSLSGILITQLHSVSLGVIAFLTNVFREIISILIVPVLARKVGMLTLVAPGGATTMDTTLPLIASVGPSGIAVVALVNGISLSMLVPVLVPLLLS